MEKQTPIAHRDVLGHLQADIFVIVERALSGVRKRLSSPVHFLGRRRSFIKLLNNARHLFLHRCNGLALFDDRAHQMKTDVDTLQGEPDDLRGLASFDQRFMQASRWRLG